MKFNLLVLAIFWAQSSFAHLLLNSKDVGVHKCEFQGRLGDESVRLYVFLTACIRPLGSELPRPATAIPIPTTAQTPPANLPSPSVTFTAFSGASPAMALAAAVAPAGDGAGGARRALREQAQAPGQAVAAAPAAHNLFLSGFAFVMQPDQPVTTTQLQQPLSTLLWAARRPEAEYFLPKTIKPDPSSSGSGGGSGSASSADGHANEHGDGDHSAHDGPAGEGGATAAAAAAAAASRRRGLTNWWWEAPPPPPTTLLAAVREAGLQLVNGTHDIITVRSLRSSQKYGMHLSYREPSQWPVNPSLRREPGRLALRLTLEPAELWSINNAAAAVQPGGAATEAAPAFEVTAFGFEGTCSYTPTRGQRQPPPPSPSAFRQGAMASGLPVCGWLDLARLSYDKSMYDFWHSLQQASGAGLQGQRRRKRKRRRPPPPPPPPPPATSFAPPTYMVVSPYFYLKPYEFVTLLRHHMEYHSAIGVHRYLVYIEEGEEDLAADPRLAALAAAEGGGGRLQLVRWRELPTFTLPGSNVRHPYASQILAYNHALLSLWHEGAVVAVADLDEYLVTQLPMRLEQVMFSCSPHGRYPPAALWVPRRSALCTSCFSALVAEQLDTRAALKIPPRAKRPNFEALHNLSNHHAQNATLAVAAADLERQLWLEAGSGGGGSAAAAAVHQHPLEHYRHWREGWHHKSIMYSHLVSYFGVHLSYSAVPSRRPHTVARLGCAVWAHLETQLGPRRGEAAAAPAGEGGRQAEGELGERGAGVAPGLAVASESVSWRGGLGPGNATQGGTGVQQDAGQADGAKGPAGDEGESEEEERGGDADGKEEEEEKEEERRPATAVEGKGHVVTPVEYRYYWAMERHLGRQVPWAQYWGQRVEGVGAGTNGSGATPAAAAAGAQP